MKLNDQYNQNLIKMTFKPSSIRKVEKVPKLTQISLFTKAI